MAWSCLQRSCACCWVQLLGRRRRRQPVLQVLCRRRLQLCRRLTQQPCQRPLLQRLRSQRTPRPPCPQQRWRNRLQALSPHPCLLPWHRGSLPPLRPR